MLKINVLFLVLVGFCSQQTSALSKSAVNPLSAVAFCLTSVGTFALMTGANKKEIQPDGSTTERFPVGLRLLVSAVAGAACSALTYHLAHRSTDEYKAAKLASLNGPSAAAFNAMGGGSGGKRYHVRMLQPGEKPRDGFIAI